MLQQKQFRERPWSAEVSICARAKEIDERKWIKRFFCPGLPKHSCKKSSRPSAATAMIDVAWHTNFE